MNAASASGLQTAAHKLMTGSIKPHGGQSVASDGAAIIPSPQQWLPSSQPKVREASDSLEWEGESDTSSVTRAKKIRLKNLAALDTSSAEARMNKANTKFLGLF